MKLKVKLIMIVALMILLFSLSSAPTSAAVGYAPGEIEPGPYQLPACWCDSYPVECYCKTRN